MAIQSTKNDCCKRCIAFLVKENSATTYIATVREGKAVYHTKAGKTRKREREREKKKTFSIKAAEIPMACALHSESPSYNIHCEQQATFIHYTHTHKKSLVKYLFPTRHSHCFLQIPDSSQYFSLTHACMPVHTHMHTHSHMHAHKHTCIHTRMHTHTPSAQSTLSLCSSILIFLILKVLLILIFHLQTKQWLCCKENKIHKATSAFNHTWKGIIIYGAHLTEQGCLQRPTHTYTCIHDWMHVCIPPPPTFIASALCVRGCWFKCT